MTAQKEAQETTRMLGDLLKQGASVVVPLAPWAVKRLAHEHAVMCALEAGEDYPYGFDPPQWALNAIAAASLGMTPKVGTDHLNELAEFERKRLLRDETKGWNIRAVVLAREEERTA